MKLNLEQRQEAAREEFHELGRERDGILTRAAPLEDKAADLAKEATKVGDALKKAKAPLYEIDMRRAEIVRQLNGKTGTPESYAKGKKAAAKE